MEQFTIKNITVRIADDINYVWVLLDEQVNREEFADSLGDAEFHALLQQHNARNLLVDCGKMWSFGTPEMSDYLDTGLTAAMREIRVRKISVVVSENVYSMLPFIFEAIENNHAENSPEIRFFTSAQFQESFESVAWFE